MKNTKIRVLVIWAAALVVCLLLNFILPGTVVSIFTKILIMALFALSLNLRVGYAGMMPLGYSVMFGVGAYAYTMAVRAGVNIWLAFLLGIVIAVLSGVIVGYLCLRGKNGMTFAFLSMALSTLIYTIVIQLNVFGRDVGLSGAKRPAFANDTVSFGVFVTVIVMVLILVLYLIFHSPFASVVTALRENEERLNFLGINTHNFQLAIFVLGSLFAGIAGVLYAMYNSGAYPSFINASTATQALMMCLIGGMSTFFGPILGAVIVTIIVTQVSNYTVYWQAVLGVIIVACVLFFRGGILGTRTMNLRKKQQMRKEAEKNG